MAAIANIVRTIFSPSPTHFEVRVLADIDMNVDFVWADIALPSKVLPVPGGPKNNTPYKCQASNKNNYSWRSSYSFKYIWP